MHFLANPIFNLWVNGNIEAISTTSSKRWWWLCYFLLIAGAPGADSQYSPAAPQHSNLSSDRRAPAGCTQAAAFTVLFSFTIYHLASIYRKFCFGIISKMVYSWNGALSECRELWRAVKRHSLSSGRLHGHTNCQTTPRNNCSLFLLFVSLPSYSHVMLLEIVFISAFISFYLYCGCFWICLPL